MLDLHRVSLKSKDITTPNHFEMRTIQTVQLSKENERGNTNFMWEIIRTTAAYASKKSNVLYVSTKVCYLPVWK